MSEDLGKTVVARVYKVNIRATLNAYDPFLLVAITESFSEEIAQSLDTFTSALTVSEGRPGTVLMSSDFLALTSRIFFGFEFF